jgi:hypothetical protein
MNTQEFQKMLGVVERRTGIQDRNVLLQLPLQVFEAIYGADSRIMKEHREAHAELLLAAKAIRKADSLPDVVLFSEAVTSYLNAETDSGIV